MKIAIKQLENRDHYVVPVVMVVEGVLHGSGGPLLYPAEELKRSAHLWNARPVVVYHPAMYADSAAGNPDVFNRQKVGTVFNTVFDGRRLKAEAWIDVMRVADVDPRVQRAIEAGQTMECSTGLFTDHDAVPGVFNGRAYDAIARNFRPDHLAILPDQVGACSMADGAGFIRNSVHELEPLMATTWP